MDVSGSFQKHVITHRQEDHWRCSKTPQGGRVDKVVFYQISWTSICSVSPYPDRKLLKFCSSLASITTFRSLIVLLDPWPSCKTNTLSKTHPDSSSILNAESYPSEHVILRKKDNKHYAKKYWNIPLNIHLHVKEKCVSYLGGDKSSELFQKGYNTNKTLQRYWKLHLILFAI